MRFFCLSILFSILLFSVARGSVINEYVDKEASASYYEYRDNDGNLNSTDNFDSIPNEYRKNAKLVTRAMRKGLPVIKTETLSDPAAWSSVSEAQSQVSGRNAEAEARDASALRLMKATGAMAVLMLFLMFAGKLGRSLEKQQLATIIRIVLTLSVLLYVFMVYQQELTERYLSIRQDVDNVQKVMEKREDKINEMAR